MAREFARSEISARPFANEVPPPSDTFKKLEAGGFADWRLGVDGMVDRPGAFSLAQLKSYPSRSQITQLACEEGWSYVAEWTGVPLSDPNLQARTAIWATLRMNCSALARAGICPDSIAFTR